MEQGTKISKCSEKNNASIIDGSGLHIFCSMLPELLLVGGVPLTIAELSIHDVKQKKKEMCLPRDG